MRFVVVRALEDQAALMHHKAREMLVAQRTQLINALRGHLAEIGVIAAQGPKNARELAGVVMAEGDETIPACVRAALTPLVRQLHALDQEIARSDRTIEYDRYRYLLAAAARLDGRQRPVYREARAWLDGEVPNDRQARALHSHFVARNRRKPKPLILLDGLDPLVYARAWCSILTNIQFAGAPQNRQGAGVGHFAGARGGEGRAAPYARARRRAIFIVQRILGANWQVSGGKDLNGPFIERCPRCRRARPDSRGV
jgi:hypothetical protein